MTSPTAKLIKSSGQSALPRLVAARASASVAPGEDTNVFGFRSVTQELPLLLAGPVLRSSSESEIMVWVAMSKPLRVSGRVLDPHLDGHGAPQGNATELGGGDGAPTKLGARLYLALLVLRPHRGTFPTRRVLVYDVTFHAPDGQVFDLDDGGFVEARDVSYGAPGLPSFLIGSPRETTLRVLHGSCRKLGGTGRDAADELDGHLRRTWNDAQERPRALLLTGDQIYADDVPGDMSRALRLASELLLGFREWVPGSTRHTDAVRQRAAFVRNHGLTVDAEAAHHHLIGFGEFAAMYLFSWSPVLWDHDRLQPLLDQARGRNYDDAARLRRALANVPTYMMMDDHEITDDWPMDLAQRDQINQTPVGRWIIANGMAACWCFQIEGNGRGRPPFLAQLTEYLERGLDLAEHYSNDRHRSYDQVADGYARSTYGTRNLGSVAPTHPPIILLDTRTQRHLSNTDAPALLDPGGLSWLEAQLGRLPADRNVPVVMVSPAPVLADEIYDQAQSADTALHDRYVADRESWSHNPGAFRDFLRTLASADRKVVVMSGDVHFAYTARGRFAAHDQGGLAIVQLTSSGMKNRPSDGLAAGLRLHSPTAGRRITHSFPGESRRLVTTLAGIGTRSTFVRNNIGIVSIDWSRPGVLRVQHDVRGEGESGHSGVTIE